MVLFYRYSELSLLQRLRGQDISRIEADGHLLVNLICRSGYSLFCTPEEEWVSSAQSTEVGYAWIKRAFPTTKNLNPAPARFGQVAGRVGDIHLLRSAMIFSVINQHMPPPQHGSIDQTRQDVWWGRSSGCNMIHPKRIDSGIDGIRYSLVDVGFTIQIGDEAIIVAPRDNRFCLIPEQTPSCELERRLGDEFALIRLESARQ